MKRELYVRFENLGYKEVYIKCNDTSEAINVIQKLFRKDSNRERGEKKHYRNINMIRTDFLNPNKHTVSTLDKVLSEE